VKLLHPALATDGPFRRRFESEARHAASLNHPNLLAIYDWDDSSRVYIVTELLAGGSLRQVLDSGQTLSPSQALLVGLEAARGLAHAHQEGFVHRDIKPANLMFAAGGRLSIADFGIARAVAEASWTEPDGALIGTARYAAPEQALGRGVDGKADVYALALTLIEAASGEVPLVGSSPLATMVLRQDTDVEVPSSLGPLQSVFSRAGSSDPTKRPSAAEFISLLEEAAAELPKPDPIALVGLPSGAEVGEGSQEVEAAMVSTRAVVHSSVDPTTPMERPEPVEVKPSTTVPAATVEPAVTAGEPRRRRRWPYVLVMLIAVLGGAAAVAYQAGTFDDLVTEPEPVVITYPLGTYVGGDISAAEREIQLNNWTTSITTTRSDGSVQGEVLTQSPAPGVQLEEGGVVSLVVSEGVLLHAVPLLVGLSREEAELALSAVDLAVGAILRTFSEEVVEGEVLEASIVPGTEVETGGAVDLTLSAGPEPRVLPQLVGRTRAEAEAQLLALGLVAVVTDAFSDTVAEGLVVSSEPPAEATVERGTEVAVVISKGLPFVQVPDVVGMSAADAADALATAGLVVTDTNGPPNKDVLATDPPAGESVRQGTGVVIFTRR